MNWGWFVENTRPLKSMVELNFSATFFGAWLKVSVVQFDVDEVLVAGAGDITNDHLEDPHRETG